MSKPKSKPPKYDRLTDDERTKLRTMVDQVGRKDVAEQLGLHEQTVLRLLAGERVQRLTLRYTREHLPRLKIEV